ncbi:MAG: C25 family cysteine peptidase [Chloroflexota bacterium]
MVYAPQVTRPRSARGLVGISLVALCVAAALTFALASPTAESAGGDGLRVLQSDANGVLLELNVTAYQLAQRTVDGQTFDVLTAPDTVLKDNVPGAPQLPMRGVLLGIPADADVSVQVVAQQTAELPQSLRLLPGPTTIIERDAHDELSARNAGAKYNVDAAQYARDVFAPQSPAQLGVVGYMRSQRFAQLSLFPFQYNAAQRRVQWVKQLRVLVRFTYPRGQSAASLGGAHDEGAYESVLQSQLVNYDSARKWRTPRVAPAKPQTPSLPPGDYRVAIGQDGLYRLTYSALTTAGVSPATDPRTFKISKNGVELPIYVSGESDGVFDPGDYVEFYALGINTVYTDVNIYWLSIGGANGQRMTTRSVAPNTAPAQTSFRDHMHVEDNHYYVVDRPLGNGDHWYWNVVVQGFPPPNSFFVASPAIYTFTLSDVDIAGTAILRTNVFGGGGNSGSASPHYQQIFVNGNLVTDDAWIGDVIRQTETNFPSTYLISGTNVISYNVVLTAGAFYDESFFNWFEVDFNRQYVARNDYLHFGVDVGGTAQVTVTNFTTSAIALYDVTNPTNTVRLTDFVAVNSGGTVAVSLGDVLSAPAKYVASAAPRNPLAITRDQSPYDLRNPENAADYIIIAADDFFTATAPLASRRVSQQLRVARVRISDVYDEFSDGVFDPTAIRAFLAYAYANWQPPAPLYVVLVGDGHMNYHNYLPNNIGGSDGQFIPPFMDAIDIYVNQAATDNRFVNLVGNDLMPDMAIGRLPVRSVTETTAVVNKILAYEQTPPPGAWRNTVAFFTDNYYKGGGSYDTAGDFYATADGLINTSIPNTYSVTRAYFCSDPCPPNTGGAPWYITETNDLDPVRMRNAITTALNTGALFANYIGHASSYQWANEGIFANEGAQPYQPDLFSQINNGNRTPIVLELTCRTSQFNLPGSTTLGESFIRADGRGAVADWGSTGLGVNTGHGVMASAFYQAIFTNNVRRIGLAINSSKATLIGYGFYNDLVDEFTLFGDPAMTIQLPLRTLYLPVIAR